MVRALRTLSHLAGLRVGETTAPAAQTGWALCHINGPQSQTGPASTPLTPDHVAVGVATAPLLCRHQAPSLGDPLLNGPTALTFDPIFLSMSSTRTFC